MMNEETILQLIEERGINTYVEYVMEGVEQAVRNDDLASAKCIFDAWNAAE